MRYVSPSRQPWALGTALVLGLVAGFAPATQIAAQLGVRPGLGNAVVVNIALPAMAFAVAVWFPRVRSAAVAGVLVVIGFTLARMLDADLRVWTWDPQFLRMHTSPILLGAALGCAVVATIGAFVGGAFRRVGERPHAPSCGRCGHALAAHGQIPTSARCPECGAEFHSEESPSNPTTC